MQEMSPYKVSTTVFYIPSFYGAVTWGAWLFLYVLRLIKLDNFNPLALALFILIELLFVLVACSSFPRYRDVLSNTKNATDHRMSNDGFPCKSLLLALHVIGFLGLSKYLMDIASYFGGFNYVLFSLLHEAANIRGDIDLPTSLGTQLSYFGWLAIAFTIFGIANKKLSIWWLLLVAFQFLGNLIYIDRTRPIWIMFSALLMIFPSTAHLNLRKILKWVSVVLVVSSILFWFIAEWRGNTYYEDKLDDSVLPGITQLMYAYGVSGFAYFNHMLVNNEPISYKPERILYPLLKLLSKLNLTEEPPSQILEFYDVPFETNVGTFLEPFYRDGGFLFVFLGVLIYSVGFDILALKLLESKNIFALFAWSNICFTTFIAFFTPKITQFPIWLFIGLGSFSLLIRQLHSNIVAYSDKYYE